MKAIFNPNELNIVAIKAEDYLDENIKNIISRFIHRNAKIFYDHVYIELELVYLQKGFSLTEFLKSEDIKIVMRPYSSTKCVFVVPYNQEVIDNLCNINTLVVLEELKDRYVLTLEKPDEGVELATFNKNYTII